MSRSMPALPQNATPTTQIPTFKRINHLASQGTLSPRLSNGNSEPTATITPMMTANPRDNPSQAIPKPKVTLPSPQASPSAITSNTVATPAWESANHHPGNTT